VGFRTSRETPHMSHMHIIFSDDCEAYTDYGAIADPEFQGPLFQILQSEFF